MSRRARNSVFILAAALLHVLGGRYSGPFEQWVYSYGSNIAVSVALFFLLQFLKLPSIRSSVANAGYALVVLFGEELAQRSSEYPGVFDTWNLLYDAIGVAAAVALNRITSAASGQNETVKAA